MKKITLFVLSIVALAGAASAQTVITDAQFTENTTKYNGLTVSISNLTLNPQTAVPSGSGVTSGGAVAAPGAGKAAAAAPGVIRCNAPRNYRAIDVDFKNDPSFNKCFFISKTLYSSLPKGQNGLNATVTFKGDSKVGYTITLFKLQ